MRKTTGADRRVALARWVQHVPQAYIPPGSPPAQRPLGIFFCDNCVNAEQDTPGDVLKRKYWPMLCLYDLREGAFYTNFSAIALEYIAFL